LSPNARTKGDIGVKTQTISETRSLSTGLRALWVIALMVGLLIAQAMAAAGE